MRQQLEGQIAFNRILAGKYKDKMEVSEADVDAKLGEIKASVNSQLAKIKADPRMQPVTVMEILEVSFPSTALTFSRRAQLKRRRCRASRGAKLPSLRQLASSTSRSGRRSRLTAGAYLLS